MKLTSVKGLPAYVSLAYLDKHPILDSVMVSVAGSKFPQEATFADTFWNPSM